MATVPFKSTAISGSIERTTGNNSYLVAGTNITITSGSGGQLTIDAAGGGGGTPGGSDTEIQFNSNGGFQASDKLTFIATGSADSTGLLTLTGSLTILSGSTEGGINMQRGGGSVAVGKNVFATPTNLTYGADYRAGNFSQGYGSSGYIKADGIGTFAQGAGYMGSVRSENFGSFSQGAAVGANIISDGIGAFAQGNASGKDIQASGYGSFAQGFAQLGGILASRGGTFAQGYGFVTASGEGSFAQGRSNSGGPILASGYGSFAQGFANSGGPILASGYGSFAQGFADYGGAILASGYGSFAQGYGFVTASGEGSFAQGSGRSNSGATILASGYGSFAHGYNYGGTIEATGEGATSTGYAHDSTVSGHAKIRATGHGSLSMGFAKSEGSYATVEATGWGSFASGFASDSGNATEAYIQATGRGSFAHGYVIGDGGGAPSRILADGDAGFASGLSYNDRSIIAHGLGSFAFGYTSGSENITCSGSNAAQFGPGVNTIDNSIQIGSKSPVGSNDAHGIRIITNLFGGGDVGDISTQKTILSPDGTRSPASANETKIVTSGSLVEKHAGVTNFAVGEFSGEVVFFGGGTSNIGQLYYLNSAGNWLQASADSAGAMSGSLLGMGIASGSITDKGILLRGFYQLPTTPNTGSYTIGAPMYVSTGSDGHIIDSPPGGSGQFVRIVGHNTTSTGLIWFNPNGTYIINS